MNLGFLFLFLIVQIAVNYFLGLFIPTNTIEGIIAFYMLSSLIISFFAAFMATPRGYKKEFYKQPGFHKAMLFYFLIFTAFDAISIIVRLF